MRVRSLMLATVAITALAGALATADARSKIDTSQDETTRQLNLDQLQKAKSGQAQAPADKGQFGGKSGADEGKVDETKPSDQKPAPEKGKAPEEGEQSAPPSGEYTPEPTPEPQTQPSTPPQPGNPY